LGEPGYMLDNAEAHLNSLSGLWKRLDLDKDVEPFAQTVSSTSITPPIQTELKESRAEPKAKLAKRQPTAFLPPSDRYGTENTEHLAAEMLELFIGEAKEEVASINHNLHAWVEAPDNLSKLVTVRRSFHTLKGSGRMVGAEYMGEFAWSIEKLMNRLINKTLVRTPPMIDFIVEATKAVPELVEQLEFGTPPETNIAQLMVRAKGFVDGDPHAPILVHARPEPASSEAEGISFEMDPVLLDIFIKETQRHLKVIYDYLDACNRSRPPYQITD
ncbi:uncharacterized protein METZ01_LOCUS419534, partial [marine metagenome]